MLKKCVFNFFALCILCGLSSTLKAQTIENPNSVRSSQKEVYGQPIYESDVMYRTSIWRNINLREKQNLPFFAIENEITKVIMDGVRAGKLQAYRYNATFRKF